MADIDDSLLPLLPTDLASEAQTLRREIEARHHRLLQERFNFGSGDRASAISALLRHSALSRHGGGSHFPRLLPSGGGLSGRVTGFSNTPPYLPSPNRKIVGRHLLDHEALACLLVLLFVEEPRLNTGRLHKVLRNLCYHEETRSWLISAMIAILRRTSGQRSDGSCPLPCMESASHAEPSSSNSQPDRTESPCRLDEYLSSQESSSDSKASKQHSWLSFGVRTSLGSRTNVFCIKRQGKAGLERSTHVSIHPQASHFVCKHVLDALLFLAKSFPASFTPYQAAQPHPSCSKEDNSSTEAKPVASTSQESTDFWDILLKLDTAGSGRKGKSAAKTSSIQSHIPSTTDSPSEEVKDFSSAPIGQLLITLSHPVVHESVVVTDKLLRLLSVTSAALPDMPEKSSKQTESSEATASETVPAETLAQTPSAEPVTQALNTSEAVSNVSVTVSEENAVTHHLTVHTPGSETESVASSLIVERSSEAGGEPHEVESLDGGSVDEPLSQPSETLSHPGMVEPMIVEVSPPVDSQSQACREDSTLLTAAAAPAAKDIPEQKASMVKESHLRLVVNVLTSGMCSEEGLEDATTLLLQVSRLNSQTRDSVLQLLLEGARRIGETLQQNIAVLLNELIEHNRNTPQKDEPEQRKGEQLRVIHVLIVRTASMLAMFEDYSVFHQLKGARSRFAHFEKFSLNFSSSLFIIRVNILHP